MRADCCEGNCEGRPAALACFVPAVPAADRPVSAVGAEVRVAPQIPVGRSVFRPCPGLRPAGALLLLALSLLLLAASAHAEGSPTLLRLIYWQNEGQRLPGAADLFDDFHDANPAIRTNVTYESWAQAYTRLRYWSNSLRQYAPDLTVIRDEWLPYFAEACLPLDEKLTASETGGVLPSVLDRCRVDGKLLGVPWIGTSRVLYYRSDLFTAASLKPPTTLTELREAARKLRTREVYGVGLPGRAGGGAVDAYLGLLWAFGGQPFEEGKLRMKTPEAAAALQYWVDLEREGLTQPEALSWSSAQLDQAFAAGRLAMVFSGPELGRYLRRAAPKLAFATAPLPADKASPGQISVDVLVALNSTKNPEQCLRLLKYMVSPRVQRAMWLMGGLPTRAEHLDQALHDPVERAFVERLRTAQGLPLMETEHLSNVIETALALALSGRQPPEEAIRSALAQQRDLPF